MHAIALLALSALAAAEPAASCPDSPAAPQGLPEAHVLLDEYRAALGAPEQLAAVKSLRIRGTGRWVGLEDEASFTNTYAGLDRGLLVTEFEKFGRFEIGTNGELVWEETPLEVKIRDGWDGSEFVRRFGVGQHTPWRALFASARTAGVETLEGAAHWRVLLQPLPLAGGAAEGAEPPPDEWFLDQETKLLRKVVAHGVGMDGAATEVTYLLGDWREVDGILYPHRLELTVSGFTLKSATTSIEHGVTIAPDFPAPSERVLQAVEDHRSGDAARRREQITVQRLEARHIASIRVTCKHAEMQKTLSQVLPEVFMHASSSGAAMTGPPLVIYHQWGDELDLEAAVPVAEPIAPKGRVKAEQLPAGDVVVAWHVGPYEKLGDTHARIQAYMDEHGLERRAAAWEEYWTDPGMEPDPAKWRTKVLWPVRGAEGD